jgi:catecholate siderophore receptor
VPGLTIAAGEGGVPAGDNLTMRGFSARNDVFVDGVRDLGPQARDPFNIEQVEVVKGPQSAYTGRGSTGGSINLISKAPNLNRYFGGSINVGSASMQRLTADANVPLARAGLGDRTALRMNALFHNAGVPGRNEVESRRTGLAPSLMFGSGSPTRLTLSYYRIKQDNLPDYGIPWVTATHNLLARDTPAPVPRETFYGLLDRDKEEMDSNLGTLRLEHDFSDTLNVRSQLRYGRSTRDSITTAPRFASNDTLVINRNSPNWYTNDKIWDNQTDLRAGFRTGAVEHSVVTGINLTREHNIRKARTITAAPTTTLLNPNVDDVWSGTAPFNPIFGDATANSQAVYAFDTIKLSQKLQLNGGFRWDRFDVDGVNTNGTPLVRTDRMLSVRAGAVYKPVRDGSFYVSYGTSLNPSLEGLTYQPANTTTEPEKTYTVEGGTKWDPLGSRLLMTAAVFNVRKTNARTPGVLPDDPPQVLDGVQRVNGLELGATGYVTPSWMVFGAYTLMDGEIIDSNTPAEVGKTFQNTPKNSVSLWSTYRVGRFTGGGGIRYVGKRFGNNTNTRQVDSYVTLDAMASYSLARQLDLRLNLYNLNNAFYFERLGGGHLIPGPARMVMVSSNFRF